MRKITFAVALFCLAGLAFGQAPKFKKVVLEEKFYCEGSNVGDFNKDGKLDVVAGPWWYQGPDFKTKHEIYPPKAFDPAPQYSDNFLTYVGDFNGDSWPDLLIVGFPGAAAHWLENPGEQGGHWKRRLAIQQVGSESPVFGDLLGDGKPRLVFTGNGYVGYAEPAADPEKPWTFIPVTPKGGYNGHGSGFGDINGDGKMDIIEAAGWWEQPKAIKPGEPWQKHAFAFGPAPANMPVYDVDGDGLNDVVTSLHCHHYGIVWYKQVRDGNGGISFKQNVIVGTKPEENPQGIKFTQHHAFDVADFNGDKLTDFVTGKRFYAHGPKGDSEPDAPCVLYWFELQRDPAKGAAFVGHLIDDNSGVGTQVTTADLNGDKAPDIIVGCKKGTFVFLSEAR